MTFLNDPVTVSIKTRDTAASVAGYRSVTSDAHKLEVMRFQQQAEY